MAVRTRSSRSTTLIIVIALVIAFSAAGSVAHFYTQWLWYRDVGQVGVFWTTILSRWAVGAVFAVLFFAVLYANVVIARRFAPRIRIARIAPEIVPGVPVQLSEVIERAQAQFEPFIRWVLPVGSALLALLAGVSMSSFWDVFRLALAAVPFGLTDPQFGRDVGFFVFTLPALRVFVDWLLSTLWLTLIIAALVHLIGGAIRPWDRLRGFEPHVKAHLSVLAGLIVAAKALDYQVRIFELNLSPRGQVLGASYTDVHAQLPALQILTVIALLTGIALMANIRYRGWRLPVYALGTWVAASILVGTLYPAIVQQFVVSPNEIALEKPYIARNLESTRQALGLDAVVTKQFDAAQSLSATDVAKGTGTLDEARIWDPKIASQVYKQLQEIRNYYDFKDVDIDRYEIDGASREVLISAREMNSAQLSDQARTWQNVHLFYTHGSGVVVSPVNESTGQGQPKFILKDIPPQSTVPALKVTRPGIYFGEEEGGYVIVDTGVKEFDYPLGDSFKTASYEGTQGVAIGGPLRRIAFALRFGTAQILFSGAINGQSKVLYHRSLTERLGQLAPWLRLDGDPYITIVGGKLMWIVDGYTTSSGYPYAQHFDGVNYIRNSVKVAIDAYDGTTTLYAWDAKDPVLATWRAIFPGLVVDASQMPAELRAHVRYPEDLFKLQAEAYKTYHMRDPQAFYNKEDQWGLPGEARGGVGMEPYYVMQRLPGETKDSFLLMVPFTPRSKDNMIGWMATRCDPDAFGQQLVYAFPKQRLTIGPEQVKARINQDPKISPQLSLWNQRGSQVIFGNLLVIPIKDSIVYVTPVYLQAESSPIPELTQVVVAYGDKVAMADDLPTAVAAVFGTAATGGSGGAGSGASSAAGGSVETTATPGATDAQRARTLYSDAIAAQKAGDWAKYGQLIKELGTVLDRLAK